MKTSTAAKHLSLISTNVFLFCLFFLLTTALATAQERRYIKGKLLYKNTNVVAANVVNNTSQTNTITDAQGEFEIPATVGDEIVFSSVQYRIRAVTITPEIMEKNRLVVSVNENINALNEVVVTPENTEKFLDLREEEFKGYDYTTDKSTKVVNRAADDRQLAYGVNFVSVAKLLSKIISGKTESERNKLKPSEVLPQVFEPSFFESALDLKADQVVGFLEYIDTRLPSQDLLQKSQEFQLIDFLIKESEQYQAQLLETPRKKPTKLKKISGLNFFRKNLT